MKLPFNKQEIQKIVLAALFLFGILHGAFAFVLHPVQTKITSLQTKLADIKKRTEIASDHVKRRAELEASAPEAKLLLNQLDSLIPDGAPVAWFPTQMESFLKHEHIRSSKMNLMEEHEAKDLPGHKLFTWNIEFQPLEFHTLACAISDFENQEILVEINRIEIDASQDDPEAIRCTLNATGVVKNEN